MTIKALDGNTTINDRPLADAVRSVQWDAGIDDSVRTLKQAAAVEKAMQQYHLAQGVPSESASMRFGALRVGRTMMASVPDHNQVGCVEISFDTIPDGPHRNIWLSSRCARALLAALKGVLEPPADEDPLPMPGAPKKDVGGEMWADMTGEGGAMWGVRKREDC